MYLNQEALNFKKSIDTYMLMYSLQIDFKEITSYEKWERFKEILQRNRLCLINKRSGARAVDFTKISDEKLEYTYENSSVKGSCTISNLYKYFNIGCLF